MGIGELFFNIWALPTVRKQKQRTKERIKEERKALKTEADVISFITQNTGTDEEYNSQTKIEAVEAYLDNLEKQDGITEKQYERLNELVLDRASKVCNAYCTGKMDSDLEKKIRTLAALNDIYRYTNAAIETNRWINYTLWVSTDPKAFIRLTHIPTNVKELVNGICKTIHADLIYPDNGCADLELYDPWMVGWQDQKFLLNLSKLQKLSTINLIDKFNKKTNGTKKAEQPKEATVLDNTITCPIHFASPNAHNTLIDPALEVNDYTKGLLESRLEPLIGPKEHWFSKANEDNTYTLYIRNPNNGIAEEFKIVMGYHGMNIPSIVVTNNLGQTIVVNTLAVDLCRRILDNCFYQVNEQDTSEAFSNQSEFFWIYNLLDLSTIDESLLRTNRLDAKINEVFGWLQTQNVFINVRYRFERFIDINNFTLISDKLVTSPFDFATDGSVIMVQNNEVMYKLGNTYVQGQIY